jgi:hypothetical protein
VGAYTKKMDGFHFRQLRPVGRGSDGHSAAPQTKMAREREWTHPCPFQSSTNPKDDYRVYHKLPVHVPLVTA